MTDSGSIRLTGQQSERLCSVNENSALIVIRQSTRRAACLLVCMLKFGHDLSSSNLHHRKLACLVQH
ncbi:MAG: hypothetical protein EBX71_03685, partial [Betaproteobacteria bacterium]|nr:hypothetical protein [Betaproteobacteria bacterium]